jgi:hypothetical protein
MNNDERKLTTEHREKRWTDNPWAVIGKGIKNLGALAGALIFIIVLSGYITKGKNALLDPHTVALAAGLDSVNNIRIDCRFSKVFCALDSVKAYQDSTYLGMAEIKCMQKRAMSSDAYLRAQKDFEETRNVFKARPR